MYFLIYLGMNMLAATENAAIESYKKNALQQLCTLLISLEGVTEHVFKEVSFLQQVLNAPIVDTRLITNKMPPRVEDIASFAEQPCPFSGNFDLKRMLEEVSLYLIRYNIANGKSLNEAFDRIELLIKRYGLNVNYHLVLTAYLEKHLKKPLRELVQSVLPFCEKHNIYLKDIRLSLAELEKNFTLLHIAIVRRSVTDVEYFVAADTHSRHYIPSTIWHKSGNNTLHFCALMAPIDGPEPGRQPVNQSLVKASLRIADLLTANHLPEHLEMDVEQSVIKNQCHPDGGTHLTSAAIRGSLTLVKYFIEKSAKVPGREVWNIPRQDGKTTTDLAAPHVKAYLQRLSVGPRPAVTQGPMPAALPTPQGPAPSLPQPVIPAPVKTAPFFNKPPTPSAPTPPSFAQSGSSAFTAKSEAKRKSPPTESKEPSSKKERPTLEGVIVPPPLSGPALQRHPVPPGYVPGVLPRRPFLPPVSSPAKPAVKPSAPITTPAGSKHVSEAKRKSPPVRLKGPETKRQEVEAEQPLDVLARLAAEEHKGPGM